MPQRKTLFILAGVSLAAGLAWWWWKRPRSASAATSAVGPVVRTTLPGQAPTARELFEIATNPQARSGHNRF